ncbi:MAG: serine/threonine-protein kinase [Anaerolineae bacterium]|nr:serine/threonine-protein kinase [Anaerolineae bacterium]
MVETQRLSNLPDGPQGHSLQSGTVLQNRWRIMGVIGVGGMASVYKARDLRFPNVTRYVAVKEMLNLASDPQIREVTLRNFEREADILATLNHPAMPEIYDYFPGSDHVYLVMEFINGQDLEAILNKVPLEKLNIDTIRKWAIELCDVLAYLHEHSPEPIIFRDVKPSNIMIDQHGNIRLIDFGIAKVFQSGQKGTLIGTEGYSAPEQYKGEASPLSDIYAVGATLHHILTRRDPRLEPPFSFAERPIRQFNPQVSSEFEAIIMRSLAYDATERYQSAREMKTVLDNLKRPLFGVGPIPGGPAAEVEEEFEEGSGSSVVPIWKFRCEDEVRSSPIVYNGIVFVGAYDHNLYALQANDGAFKWNFATEGGIAATPEPDPDNNIVIVGSEDGVIYAIDMRTGRIVWTIGTERPVRCTASVAHQHVFVGGDDGTLYAARTNNGRIIWKYESGGPIRSRPWITDELIIFGSGTGEVTALDLGGSLKWRFRARLGISSSIFVQNNVAYFGANDGHIYAVDAQTGYSIWRFRTQKPVWSTPTVAAKAKLLFAGSVDGNLYALDVDSGRERWRYNTENQITSSPAVDNDSVYFGGIDGMVYCLDTKKGDLRWSFETGGPVPGSPFVNDNTVYIGSSDNYVYALMA